MTEVLGTDLYVSSSFNALWRPAGADLAVDTGGDLAAITGTDNFKQALVDRMITEIGELRLHPAYGLDVRSFIGKKFVSDRLSLLKINLLRCLKQEPRIRQIKKLALTQDPQDNRVCRVEIDIVPIDSEDSLKLNLVYDFYGTSFVFAP